MTFGLSYDRNRFKEPGLLSEAQEICVYPWLLFLKVHMIQPLGNVYICGYGKIMDNFYVIVPVL